MGNLLICFLSLFTVCELENDGGGEDPAPSPGPVPSSIVIVGAGLSGLTAGYNLAFRGFENFRILEAANQVGGRVRDLTGFAAVPLDLGSEFAFETRAGLLSSLLFPEDIADFEANLQYRAFTPGTIRSCDSGERRQRIRRVAVTENVNDSLREDASTKLSQRQEPEGSIPTPSPPKNTIPIPTLATADAKHRGLQSPSPVITSVPPAIPSPSYTCQVTPADTNDEGQQIANGSFFSSYVNRYLASRVQSRITLNAAVTNVDYTNPNSIVLTLSNGSTVTAETVILSLPASAYRNNRVTFTPALPAAYTSALDSVPLVPGIRAWIEFSERFFDESIMVEGTINGAFQETNYFNALYAQDGVSGNILTMQQTFGDSNRHTKSDSVIIAELLAELDGIYNNRATATFMRARVQNWSNENFIFYTLNGEANTEALSEPISNRIYFTGEYVDEASQGSASNAVNSILGIETDEN